MSPRGLVLGNCPQIQSKQSKNAKFPSNSKAIPIDLETQISLSAYKPLQKWPLKNISPGAYFRIFTVFDIRLSYKHCNFSHGCLLIKMASKTLTRSIMFLDFHSTKKWMPLVDSWSQWPWLKSNWSWLWYILAIVLYLGYITAHDQSIMKSGMTEGGKNTASFLFQEWTGTITQTSSLKLKSNNFQSYPRGETAASGGKRCKESTL